MLGAFRSADAGPRGAAARIGLAALLACIGLTWTAGATSAFATYGTVKITKINEGGDPADSFHFTASKAIDAAGGFDVLSGKTYSSGKVVHDNTGSYSTLGAYTVTEPATDTSGANGKYDLKSISCSATNRYGNPSTASYGTPSLDTRSVSVRIKAEETLNCTFTNQRKTGTITVKKVLVPATDPGTFDLQVDGKNVATQVGDNGSGYATVVTGTHTVGEAGATLGDYASYTSCKNGSGYEVVKGSGVVNVPVASKDAITCTITNTRKPTPTPPSTPQPPSTPAPQPQPQPAPAQAVAGVTVSRPARGTAAFQGPRACPRTTLVSASVRGRQIRRVTFFVSGHKVKTVTTARNGRWTLTVRTSSLRRGANAVTARVEFTKASRTKTRTLRITVTRCAAQVAQPQFTG
jgi:prealbumin domain-containing protein